MISVIKSHLPETRQKWKTYFLLFYPMLIAAITYSLNGFVDNFMVGQIEQGATALAAVNSWTGIIIGIYIGISSSASFVMAKYFYTNQIEKTKEIFKLRILFSVSFGIIMAMIALFTPDTLIKVFLKKPESENFNEIAYNLALQNSRDYIKIISIQWVLISITLNFANSLRETGYGKAPMYWGILALITNIALNSILMYGFHFGVEGAAWASVAARVVAFSIGIYWIIFKNVNWGFKPWTIFKISKQTIKDFFAKFHLFISLSLVFFFIMIRNTIYDFSYPVGKDQLGTGVSAMSILGLVGAIMHVFTTTFPAVSGMSAALIAKLLSQNKTQKAFEEAKRLKGFIILASTILSLLMFLTALFVPYFTFLSRAKYDGSTLTFDNLKNLRQVRNSLIVVCFYYPIWIWASASYRAGCSGTKGFWFSFADIILTGPFQIGWLLIVSYFILPESILIQENFFIFYFIFFVSDFIKLIIFELLFYKYKWNVSITKIKEKQIRAELKDRISAARFDK